MSTNEELRAEQRARVLSCIRKGADLANTRSWIAMSTGLSDRAVRERIEELRKDRHERHLICNLQDGRGYFLAEDPEDVRAQYKLDCARLRSLWDRMKPFRDYLKEIDGEYSGQLSFEDMALEEIISRGEI